MPPQQINLKNSQHVQVPSARAHAAVGSLLRILAQIASLGCGVLIMGYLTRKLGLSDYGNYALTVVLSNWVGMIIGTLTGGSTVRLVAGNHDGRRYAVSMLKMVLFFGVVAGGILYLLSGLIADLVHAQGIAPFLRIMALNAPLGAVAALYIGILTAQGRILWIIFFSSIGYPLQFAMVLLLVGHGWGIHGALTSIVFSSAVQLVLGIVLTRISPFDSDRVRFFQLWSSMRAMSGAQMTIHFIQSMDLILVKYFLHSSWLAGLYAGAQNIGFASIMLFNPSSGIVLQSISKSKLHGRSLEGDHTTIAYLRVALIYGGLLIALSGLSSKIVLFLLGADFQSSSPVLMILLWAAGFRIASLAGQTLVLSEGERISFLPALRILLVVGFLFYGLILSRYGVNGGACVTAGISLILAVITLREGLKLTGISFPWGTLLRVILAVALTQLFCCGFNFIKLPVLIVLSLAASFYLAALTALRELKPTREHFRVAINSISVLLGTGVKKT